MVGRWCHGVRRRQHPGTAARASGAGAWWWCGAWWSRCAVYCNDSNVSNLLCNLVGCACGQLCERESGTLFNFMVVRSIERNPRRLASCSIERPSGSARPRTGPSPIRRRALASTGLRSHTRVRPLSVAFPHNRRPRERCQVTLQVVTSRRERRGTPPPHPPTPVWQPQAAQRVAQRAAVRRTVAVGGAVPLAAVAGVIVWRAWAV